MISSKTSFPQQNDVMDKIKIDRQAKFPMSPILLWLWEEYLFFNKAVSGILPKDKNKYLHIMDYGPQITHFYHLVLQILKN